MTSYPPILFLPDGKSFLSITRLQSSLLELRYKTSPARGVAVWTVPEILPGPDQRTYDLYVDDVASLHAENKDSGNSKGVDGGVGVKMFAVWATIYTFFNTVAVAKVRTGKPDSELKLRIKTQELSRWDAIKDVLDALESTGLVFATNSAASSVPEEYFTTRSVFWQTQQFPFLPHLDGDNRLVFSFPHTSSNSPLIYTPKPLLYTHTPTNPSGIHTRHPLRPHAPPPGTTFYKRYVPGLSSFLSFRTAGPADVPTLHKWMNNPRVDAFWAESGPESHQAEFLRKNLSLGWSFPVIASWSSAHFPSATSTEEDGEWAEGEREDFGYFEIYWVKEDRLGGYTHADDWDRGCHILVGEEKFRGSHRVREWLGGLVHYMLLADPRTQTVMLEPRVDNEK